MTQKIELNTMTDIQNFVNAISSVQEEVLLEDREHHSVDGHSYLGICYAKLEWNCIYCRCEKDISSAIFPWIV